MGLLSSLLNRRTRSEEFANDSYSQEIERCLIEVKLTKATFRLFSIHYYRGYTSYRDYFLSVFMKKMKYINEIVASGKERAKNGCNVDFTFIRFKYNDKQYIDIPFEVFSDKKNMPVRRRKLKLWDKANIKRLIATNPNIRTLDDKLISEAIAQVKNEQ